ncbi:MAG: C25 family cysteine peptidase [Phycisphaerales bacterium]
MSPSPWALLLVVHAGATWFMTGLIWFVQVVHYPLFAAVGDAGAARYAQAHQRRTTMVVGPAMLVEALAAIAIALLAPEGLVRAIAWTGAALLAAIWCSTAALQVPMHARLAQGPDADAVRRLVRGNWLRTIAWSLRAVLAGALLLGTLGAAQAPESAPGAAPRAAAPRDVPPADAPRLAIVAPRAWLPALDAFVQAKSARYRVNTIALEDALAAAKDDAGGGAPPGSDDPERLKRHLYAEWKRDPAPLSVLLVGDADTVPVRYMSLDRVCEPAFDIAFYPCDLYYADLARADGSFDDWNAARDGHHASYFGEVHGEKHKQDPMNFDRVSYVPEVALGRWPVSTPEQAAAVARKSIEYDASVTAPAAPTAANAPRALLAMVGGWVDARPAMDRIAAALQPRVACDRLYFQDGAAQWSLLDPPDAAHVLAHLNAADARAAPRFVLHAGHGADDRWEQSIGTHDIAAMRGAPAVFMSAGCSTARFATLPPYESYDDVAGARHAGTNAGEIFRAPPPPPATYARGADNRTGLGEELVRAPHGGAVVYIGCNTGSQPAALTLLAGFADGIAQLAPEPGIRDGTVTAGQCWKFALAEYVRRERLMELAPTPDWYPASIFFQGMKFMYFGDPTAPVLRGVAPSR